MFVHSSLSSFGHVENGAMAVISALLEVVGPEGNVMVPTLTGRKEDGPDNPPFFDVFHTPCWTGIIPNTFMHLPDAKRSLHPTHSVAVIGAKANELIDGHHLALLPCAEGTPYTKLGDLGGYILLLGVGQESNTMLHGVEELTAVPYHLQENPTTSTVVDYDKNEMKVTGYLHDWGTPRRFGIIDDELLRENIMKKTMIGKSEVRLIRIRPLIELLVPRLKEDPYFLTAS